MPCKYRVGTVVQLYSLLTSALKGDGWLTPCPGRFNPQKQPQYPLYRSLGESKGQFGWAWRRENLFPHQGSNPELPSL